MLVAIIVVVAAAAAWIGVRLWDQRRLSVGERFLGLANDPFQGRRIAMYEDVVLIAGDPGGQDAELHRDVARLSSAMRDIQTLVAAIPQSFWRAVEAG